MSVKLFARYLCLAVVVFQLLSLAAAAQTSGMGSILGTIKDGTGAVIPGVTVQLSNPGVIGGNHESLTDEAGNYRFPRLVPGNYKVTAELPGFRTTVKEGVPV